MKILVTGASGQLGSDVVKDLNSNELTAIPTTHETLDITNKDAVVNFFSNEKIDAVIHCAAWTNVDLAEDEAEECFDVNANGTKNIADSCETHNIPLLYISTDYVFDGSGKDPWKIDSPVNPVNQYGRSKCYGEYYVRKLDKHFIVRTSWVYGANGKNFVKTMLNLSETRAELNVVFDQIGSPTYTSDLAPLLREMITTDRYGTYHAHNEGYCSWSEFATEIMKQSGRKTKIVPIDSASYPAKAKRPSNSRLDTDNLIDAGFRKLPKWEEGLHRFLKEIDVIH